MSVIPNYQSGDSVKSTSTYMHMGINAHIYMHMGINGAHIGIPFDPDLADVCHPKLPVW